MLIEFLKELSHDVVKFENSISDMGYSVDEALKMFPEILNSFELAKLLWSELEKDNLDTIYINYNGCELSIRDLTETLHLNWVMLMLSKCIREEFLYTNTKLKYSERKKMFAKQWMFSRQWVLRKEKNNDY